MRNENGQMEMDIIDNLYILFHVRLIVYNKFVDTSSMDDLFYFDKMSKNKFSIYFSSNGCPEVIGSNTRQHDIPWC